MTIDNTNAYTDATGNPTKWTVKMYQVWLRARGFDLKDKINDLSKRVLHFFVTGMMRICTTNLATAIRDG
jgi:hypothetical protein